MSPYAGTRPRQRSFTEILGDQSLEEPSSPSNGRGRSQSPNKAVAPKAGGSKNFQPNRLFEANEGAEPVPDTTDKNQSPDRFYRPNPRKFQHFDFADGSDPQDAPKPSQNPPPKTKRGSHWTFEEWENPEKAIATRTLSRPQDVRHWGADDENEPPADSPPRKTQQVKPRRDAQTHFEMLDDGGPVDEPRLIGRPRGSAHNDGLGLYKNNLFNEDSSPPEEDPDSRALGNITNLKDRHKDFDAHFNFTDQPSPHQSGAAQSEAKISDGRKKAVKMMESNWSAHDESPTSQKENSNPTSKPASKNRGIAISGDGMGGRKGTSRTWAFDAEADEEPAARPAPGRKAGPSQKTKASSLWDF